jgi:hypothetical protein
MSQEQRFDEASMPPLETASGILIDAAKRVATENANAVAFGSVVRSVGSWHTAALEKHLAGWKLNTTDVAFAGVNQSGILLALLADCDNLVRLAGETHKQLCNASLRCLLDTPDHDLQVMSSMAHWPLLTALRSIEPLVDGCGWTHDKQTWLITIPEDATHLQADVVENQIRQTLLLAHGRDWRQGTVRVLKGDPRITHKILGASYLCSPVYLPSAHAFIARK